MPVRNAWLNEVVEDDAHSRVVNKTWDRVVIEIFMMMIVFLNFESRWCSSEDFAGIREWSSRYVTKPGRGW